MSTTPTLSAVTSASDTASRQSASTTTPALTGATGGAAALFPASALDGGNVIASDATGRAGRPRIGRIVSELTKARLTAMVLVTTGVGFVLGSPGPVAGGSIALGTLAVTIVGTALAAASASILNQVFESERDARMRRTRSRPLPSGHIGSTAAIGLAMLTGWSGVMILGLGVNPLAAMLALVTILLYAFVYTPLKAHTTLNTLVGAVTGAIPPMIGWAAATGSLGVGAWVLGAILFVWQLPHFLSLAWLYRDDYQNGGFVMLPLRDPRGTLTAEITLMTSLLLIPIGVLPFLVGVAGAVYAIGSVALAGAMVLVSVRFLQHVNDGNARRVFLASIIYLPLLLGLMVFDRGPILKPALPELPLPSIASISLNGAVDGEASGAPGDESTGPIPDAALDRDPRSDGDDGDSTSATRVEIDGRRR